MKLFRSILLSSIFLIQLADAKSLENKNVNDQGVKNNSIQFKVVFGEKETVFKVSPSKLGGAVDYSNNFGARNSRKISLADYVFFKSKVDHLSGPTNKKEFCNRDYIELSFPKRELIGCLRAENKLASEMREMTNLLSLLF